MHADCDGKELVPICTESHLKAIEDAAQVAMGYAARESDGGWPEELSVGAHMYNGLAGIVGAHFVALLTSAELKAAVFEARRDTPMSRLEEMD
jgi:hypothetical protein